MNAISRKSILFIRVLFLFLLFFAVSRGAEAAAGDECKKDLQNSLEYSDPSAAHERTIARKRFWQRLAVGATVTGVVIFGSVETRRQIQKVNQFESISDSVNIPLSINLDRALRNDWKDPFDLTPPTLGKSLHPHIWNIGSVQSRFEILSKANADPNTQAKLVEALKTLPYESRKIKFKAGGKVFEQEEIFFSNSLIQIFRPHQKVDPTVKGVPLQAIINPDPSNFNGVKEGGPIVAAAYENVRQNEKDPVEAEHLKQRISTASVWDPTVPGGGGHVPILSNYLLNFGRQSAPEWMYPALADSLSLKKPDVLLAAEVLNTFGFRHVNKYQRQALDFARRATKIYNDQELRNLNDSLLEDGILFLPPVNEP